MAQWNSFLPQDGYQPEIVVGMYDRWLSQLEFGPTQAERALVHTPMMDLAHERRFVVSEMEQSMSDFETNHRRQIGQTIEHLQSHFSNHPADELEDSVAYRPRALIGLAPLSAELKSLDSFRPTNLPSDAVVPPLEQVLQSLSPTSVPQAQPIYTEMHLEPSLTADESETTSDRSVEARIEEIKSFSKQYRQLTPKRPRQQKALRFRKDVPRRHRSKSDSSDTKPHCKRARR